jgi:hypothetical protein
VVLAVAAVHAVLMLDIDKYMEQVEQPHMLWVEAIVTVVIQEDQVWSESLGGVSRQDK